MPGARPSPAAPSKSFRESHEGCARGRRRDGRRERGRPGRSPTKSLRESHEDCARGRRRELAGSAAVPGRPPDEVPCGKATKIAPEDVAGSSPGARPSPAAPPTKSLAGKPRRLRPRTGALPAIPPPRRPPIDPSLKKTSTFFIIPRHRALPIPYLPMKSSVPARRPPFLNHPLPCPCERPCPKPRPGLPRPPPCRRPS